MDAKYYQKTCDKQVVCQLCPRMCRLSNHQMGYCRGRKNVDGEMQLLHVGKITTAHLDPIEKKPFAMFMPGSKVFSIGGYGCNFNCPFCQNWPIVYDADQLYEVGFQTLVDNATQNGSIGLAFTYNEPTVWYEYMLSLAIATKQKGAVNVMVSNGHIHERPFLELVHCLDAVNIDLKFADNASYWRYAGGSFDHTLKMIALAHMRIHVEVSMLIIDGINSGLAQIEAMVQSLAAIDPTIPVHINRYYPAFRLKTPATNIETMHLAETIAKRHLKYVFLGNMPHK